MQIISIISIVHNQHLNKKAQYKGKI